jgi:hypothetical protein
MRIRALFFFSFQKGRIVMKKLLIVALMLAVLPAFAVEFGGKIDLNYHMETPNDDISNPKAISVWSAQRLHSKKNSVKASPVS